MPFDAKTVGDFLSGPNHLYYEFVAFTYTAYPTVLLEIDCFDASGHQTNCYQYHYTWPNLTTYTAWVALAQSLKITGSDAHRYRLMWDAMNQFLRSPFTLPPNTTRSNWVLVQKQSGPCATHLTGYFPFDEAAGDYVDKVTGIKLPKGSLLTVPGKIGNCIQFPSAPYTAGPTTGGSTFTSATSKGVSLFCWLSKGGLFLKRDNFCLSSDGLGTGGTNYFAGQMHAGPFSLNMDFSFLSVTGSQTDATTAFMINGVFYFLCWVWDMVGHTVTLYWEGAVLWSGPDTGLSLADGTMLLSMELVAGVLEVDELGWCLDWVLTPTQITALYNGGSGVTWPAVATIIN